MGRHVIKSISSTVSIRGSREIIWDNITNVKIEQFSDPWVFRLLGIPKPLKAELISEGLGGKRIAYFNGGKRFIQEITTWKPMTEYSFDFNPEKGFVVGYFFDLSEGVFRIDNGTYYLEESDSSINLRLSTTYSLDRNAYFFLNLPVRLVLKLFQKYLLNSIKKSSE